MAKKRYISDIIWSDNWFEDLQPKEKLLFLYLLTNQQVSICGIYEISLKKIEFETGISKKELEAIINKFEDEKKVFYTQGFIIISNFIKNQGVSSENDNLFKGIKRELEDIGLDKIKTILSYKGLARVFIDTCKVVPILNLTLLNLTLLNSNESTLPIENFIEEKIEIPKEKESKNKYGQYGKVLLTIKEYNKLIEDFGETTINEYIKRVDEYIQMKGAKYKDHNLVIRNWINKDGNKTTHEIENISLYEKQKEEKLKRLYGEKRINFI